MTRGIRTSTGLALPVALAVLSAGAHAQALRVESTQGQLSADRPSAVALKLAPDVAIKGLRAVLVLDDDARYALNAAEADVEGDNFARFSNVAVTPRHAWEVADDLVRGRVLIPAQNLSAEVRLRLTAPSRVTLVANALPAAVAAGSKAIYILSAHAGADSVRFPVKGVRVHAILDGIPIGSGVSDSTGRLAIEASTPPRGPGSALMTFQGSNANTNVIEHPVQLQVGNAERVVVTMPAGNTVTVNEAFPLEVMAVDGAGHPASDSVASLQLAQGGRLYADSQPTATHHLALARGKPTVKMLTYVGPAGTQALTVTVGSASYSISLTVKSGVAYRLLVVGEPHARFIPDSLLSPSPRVQVVDAGMNPVQGAAVEVRLCYNGVYARCKFNSSHEDSSLERQRSGQATRAGAAATSVNALAYLRGRTVRSSDTIGSAAFDSLAIVGPTGMYRLGFRLVSDYDDEPLARTSPLSYDAEHVYNRSFVVISAIRSIAGNSAPPNEFFDIRFWFRLRRDFYALQHSDLSLVRRSATDEDSVRSSTRRLVDAAVLLNWSPGTKWTLRDSLTGRPDRMLFVGGQARIFSTVAHIGAQVGSVELGGSLFGGSSMSIGYLTPLQSMPVRVDGESYRPAPHNLVVDAFVRSSGLDFFKFLNLRGVVLVPFGKGRRPSSRIVIAVPVGGIVMF